MSEMDSVPNVSIGPSSKPADVDRLRSRERTVADVPKPSEQAGTDSHDIDCVELSETGLLMALSCDLDDVRLDKVVRIRAELDAGTYESPEKIRVTVVPLRIVICPECSSTHGSLRSGR